MGEVSRRISAAEFKAQCLKLMDNVADNRLEIVITKRGQPVAKLVPYEDVASSVWGFMAGTAIIHGDILDVPVEDWDAENE